MKNYAVINGRAIALSPLDTIRVVADHLGYFDVDVEPGTDRWTLKATRGSEPSVHASGATFEELCDRFVAKVLT